MNYKGTSNFSMNPIKDNELEKTQAQIRKGLLEFCILLTISGEAVYSSDILQRLKDSDMLVVEGTLYPLLSRLRTSGLLSYQWQESPSGPPRKYYSLTDEGHRALERLVITWNDLDASITSLLKRHKKHEKNG